MNWKENIARWRSLTPEEVRAEGRRRVRLPQAARRARRAGSERVHLRRNWEAIPLDVARSMAFEREPVAVERIRETLAQIEPPALLKPRTAS